MKLGSVIKEARQKLGIKQYELAKLSGITQTYLSQIESNEKEPNISTLKEISSHINLPIPILFFLSLDENDIAKEKRDAFKMVDQPIKLLIKEFFNNASENSSEGQ